MSSSGTELDLVIRGGTVVDGSGGKPFEADVAIAGGRIVEVGKVAGRGAEEIDARGKIVTPGFVDIHTHYDAQATWSSRIDSSCYNGVTTALIGNCGVGFAPCLPAAARRAGQADGRRRGPARGGAGRGPALDVGDLRRVHGYARTRATTTWTSPPR